MKKATNLKRPARPKNKIKQRKSAPEQSAGVGGVMNTAQEVPAGRNFLIPPPAGYWQSARLMRGARGNSNIQIKKPKLEGE